MISRILLVEDDTDLTAYLLTLLREQDYAVKHTAKGSDVLFQIEKFNPDLVILDLGLPDIDGHFLCQKIKEEYPEVAVIILTGRDTTEEKVKGLEEGADDYLTKPFEPDELFARIKKRIKRDTENEVLKVSDLTLNPQTVEVKRKDKIISLTPQEFKLLEYLMKNAGIVLTREMILNRIWLYSPDVDTRVVDVYVGYLRKKIDSGFKEKLIHSIRGFGYTIKAA